MKKIVDSDNFSAQFIKMFSRNQKIGYNINILQQTARLVVNLIRVGNFAFLFNCMSVVGVQNLWQSRLRDLSIDEMRGAFCFDCFQSHRNLRVRFCAGIQFYLLLSPYLCLISFLYLDLYILGHDTLYGRGLSCKPNIFVS